MTPGRKPSTTQSAVSNNLRKTWRPASCLRSSLMLRLPRLRDQYMAEFAPTIGGIQRM